MKVSTSLWIWMGFLFFIIITLSYWAIVVIPETQYKVQVFAIIGAIATAFTSVLALAYNNSKAREREYDLLLHKEKQKVYSHFYEVLFKSVANVKAGKDAADDAILIEMMEFKKGLMNWGSEQIIRKFIQYELILGTSKDTMVLVVNADDFLKAIRKEMGYKVSDDISLISILLNNESRSELNGVHKSK